jgi:hypothetical protein
LGCTLPIINPLRRRSADQRKAADCQRGPYRGDVHVCGMLWQASKPVTKTVSTSRAKPNLLK